MVFSAFSKMINNIPVEGVLKALDLERKMLEEDLKQHRLTVVEEALSIVGFIQFVQNVQAGKVTPALKPSPPDYLEFYKETLVRLINASELSASAMEQFDRAFSDRWQ